jgi:uncharacterized protein (TIGR02598 family)
MKRMNVNSAVEQMLVGRAAPQRAAGRQGYRTIGALGAARPTGHRFGEEALLRETLHPRAARANGFTLVEVALAMAVAAFALVGILGLFSSGLQSSRGVADNTLAATIANNLIQQYSSQGALSTSYNYYFRFVVFTNYFPQAVSLNARTLSTNNIYFDSDGRPTGHSQGYGQASNGGFMAVSSIAATDTNMVPKSFTITIQVMWPYPANLNTNTYVSLMSFP